MHVRVAWCGNDSIEYTDCYKYLDVEFKEHPSWAKVFESTSLKASGGSQLPDSKNAIKWCIRMYNVYTHLYSLSLNTVASSGTSRQR